jgi:outer membrane biosynthesis protein TonB
VVDTPISTSEITPPAVELNAPSSSAAESETEEFSKPAIFSKSLANFEDTRPARFRVMPYAVVLLAVIAVISVWVVKGHWVKTPSAVASQKSPSIIPQVPQKQLVELAPSDANPTELKPSLQASIPQPDGAPKAEIQSAPPLNQSVAATPSDADHAPDTVRVPAQENAKGLVTKRVIPSASPSALAGIERPVRVLLRVSVDKDGAVSNVEYLTPGPGNYFARISQHAARSWEFKPPIRNGDPARSVWTLLFDFGREKTDVTAVEEKR